MPWTDQLPSEIVDALPEEIKNSEMLNRYKTIEDLARGHVETKAAMGQSIRIPTEHAGPEARTEFINKLVNTPEVMLRPDFTDPEQSQEFYSVLGKPKEAAGYENSEGTELDADVESELRDVLFKANLTNNQYQKVMSAFSTRQKETLETNKSTHATDMSSLKGKWGLTLEQRLEAAQKTNSEFFPGRPFDGLSSSDIEGLYKIHECVTAPSMQVANQSGQESGSLTPAEALRQAEELMNNPQLFDPLFPHTEKLKLMKRHTELLTMAGYETELPRA